MDAARVLVRSLTCVHALGSLVVLGMAVFVTLDPANADRLAVTPGGRQLVGWTGRFLPLFFVALGLFLGALAWGSHHRQAWSWPAAVAAYGVGVVGSLAELAAGHANYAVSLGVNGAVLAGLLSRPVRRAFQPRLVDPS